MINKKDTLFINAVKIFMEIGIAITINCFIKMQIIRFEMLSSSTEGEQELRNFFELYSKISLIGYAILTIAIISLLVTKMIKLKKCKDNNYIINSFLACIKMIAYGCILYVPFGAVSFMFERENTNFIIYVYIIIFAIIIFRKKADNE